VLPEYGPQSVDELYKWDVKDQRRPEQRRQEGVDMGEESELRLFFANRYLSESSVSHPSDPLPLIAIDAQRTHNDQVGVNRAQSGDSKTRVDGLLEERVW